MNNRDFRLIKNVSLILITFVISLYSTACVSGGDDLSDCTTPGDSTPAYTFVESTSIVNTSSPDDAADSTVSAFPEETPMVSLPQPTHSEKEEIKIQIAESFFNGTWESSSGMFYIFDGEQRTVVLKEKSSGEVLLEGSYESSTEDFSEFRLSMTFHGETDSFIAWKYDDTGSVRLIIEETGKTYDLLWRADVNS